MNKKALLEKAIRVYGESAQIDVAIEEMAELTKALLKLRRAFPNMQCDIDGAAKFSDLAWNINDEVADVQIMLDQLRILFGPTDDHEKRKLERLEKRLEGME